MSITDATHLLPISDTHKSIEGFDSSDSDDDVELVSNFDTQDNELVDMNAYLRIGSSEELDVDNDDPFPSILIIGSICSDSENESEGHPVNSFDRAGYSATVSPSL